LRPGASARGLEHWRILYLDGIHFDVRHGDQADSTMILTVLGVDLDGNKEVLARRSCAEEDKDGWVSVLQDLRRRGATQIDLIVTDGHDGLLVAVQELFPATPRQRCLVHKQRNVLNAIKRRERGNIQAELVGIWKQPTKQEALIELATFKAKYAHRYPEAVRSLVEDEEQRYDLLCLSSDDAPLHSDHQCHRESLEPRPAAHRPDRLVYHGDELPDHRLGNDRRHSVAKSPGRIDRV
jgi:transposase-like protein